MQEMPERIKALLHDRFKLALHTEIREALSECQEPPCVMWPSAFHACWIARSLTKPDCPARTGLS